MNRVILCEGKSDAILLSYYLNKVSGWEYSKKPPFGLKIRTEVENQSAEWYKRGEDYLLICGVGGKDSFAGFFQDAIYRPIVDSTAFSRIAIMTDRDNRDIEMIEKSLGESIVPFFSNCRNRSWVENQYTDSSKREQSIQALLLVIPMEQEGALENVLLDAVSEDAYDRNIVKKSRAFVSAIRPEADKYISSNRLQIKADLGVVWAVQSPEKVFSLLDEQLKSVAWEQHETLRLCFGPLESI